MYILRIHEADSFLSICFDLSKWPHFHRTYLVTVCKQRATYFQNKCDSFILNPLSTRSVCFSTHPSKNEIFKSKFLHFFKSNFKIWLKQKIAVDNIFHLVYSLCFYSKNQLNYNQFSEPKKSWYWKGSVTI